MVTSEYKGRPGAGSMTREVCGAMISSHYLIRSPIIILFVPNNQVLACARELLSALRIPPEELRGLGISVGAR